MTQLWQNPVPDHAVIDAVIADLPGWRNW